MLKTTVKPQKQQINQLVLTSVQLNLVYMIINILWKFLKIQRLGRGSKTTYSVFVKSSGLIHTDDVIGCFHKLFFMYKIISNGLG